jgi:hypothetical protein
MQKDRIPASTPLIVGKCDCLLLASALVVGKDSQDTFASSANMGNITEIGGYRYA